MRIRVLQTIYYEGKKHYHIGEVVDAPDDKAKIWLKAGLAMQDKSLDGASETKADTQKTNKKQR